MNLNISALGTFGTSLSKVEAGISNEKQSDGSKWTQKAGQNLTCNKTVDEDNKTSYNCELNLSNGTANPGGVG